MPLRLGVDFGTATTCVSVVRDLTSFIPEVVPISADSPFVDSLVWITEPIGARPLVESRSRHDRSPTKVFLPADEAFSTYWQQRVEAQKDCITWNRWEEHGREKSMLLSFFKPELADNPRPSTVQVVDSVSSVWDPLAQSEDVHVTYANRTIANPAPDSDDLVAATSAVLRAAVEAATRRFNDRVELLLVGMPSMAVSRDSTSEYSNALRRRAEAVNLARIKEDFGTASFRFEVYGEAEAAGHSIDPDLSVNEAFAIVIDAGAGTTDMALVPFSRGRRGRLEAGEALVRRTVRYGGRNLNEAIAGHLRKRHEIEQAYRAMDVRSWQCLLDRDVERIKRALSPVRQKFSIPFHLYAARPYEGLSDNPAQRALLKTAFLLLDSSDEDFCRDLQDAWRPWVASVRSFLVDVASTLGGRDPHLIELVGGALRFEPLREALSFLLYESRLDSVPQVFRDDGTQAQTAVARGLARRAAQMP